MTISKFCIKHKVTTLLAVILILVFGVVFTTQLQMSLLPNMSYPAAYVYCYYNGGAGYPPPGIGHHVGLRRG